MPAFRFKEKPTIVIDDGGPKFVEIPQAIDIVMGKLESFKENHANVMCAAQIDGLLAEACSILADVRAARGPVEDLPPFPGIGIAQVNEPRITMDHRDQPGQVVPPIMRPQPSQEGSQGDGSTGVTKATRDIKMCWNCKRPMVFKPGAEEDRSGDKWECPGECKTFLAA